MLSLNFLTGDSETGRQTRTQAMCGPLQGIFSECKRNQLI